MWPAAVPTSDSVCTGEQPWQPGCACTVCHKTLLKACMASTEIFWQLFWSAVVNTYILFVVLFCWRSLRTNVSGVAGILIARWCSQLLYGTFCAWAAACQLDWMDRWGSRMHSARTDKSSLVVEVPSSSVKSGGWHSWDSPAVRGVYWACLHCREKGRVASTPCCGGAPAGYIFMYCCVSTHTIFTCERIWCAVPLFFHTGLCWEVLPCAISTNDRAMLTLVFGISQKRWSAKGRLLC